MFKSILISLLAYFIVFADNRGELYEYDPGPDVSTEAGEGYARIFASTPNYRAIGDAVLPGRGDKFRWKFGPMFYRGRLGKDEVKVLIIGQEGAQDENISFRSFTGGTGGRMQHTLSALGIDRSHLFINTFQYTITGQYADYAPLLRNGKVIWHEVVTDKMFKLSQNPVSPIVDHRHELIDHVIESNRNSLKLIIAVGGAAQDTLATYILAKGGECEAEVKNPKEVQLVQYSYENAGGNRNFYFPVNQQGKNLLLNPNENDPDYSDDAVQARLRARANEKNVLNQLVRRTDGKLGNGLNDLRQLGSDLYSCKVGGRKNTLKGLRGITQDIRYVQVMHPGSNSPRLLENFKQALRMVKEWDGSSWSLPADKGMKQPFDQGYTYSHKAVPRRDFRFGLPEVVGQGTTMSTRRDGGAAIEFGSRDSGKYPRAEDAFRPEASYLNTDLSYEPSKTNYKNFDRGPGEKWAKIFLGLTDNTPVTQFESPISENKFSQTAIYRGRPESAEVFVLADQTSHDDMWVGRALMGEEGQKLQAFLQGIGAGLNYVILRTMPVDTLGASDQEIRSVMTKTAQWRKAVSRHILSNRKVELVLTLGKWADSAVKELGAGNVATVSLTQGYDKGFEQVKKVWKRQGMRLQTDPMPIAREDIPYGLPRWVGTSGDRVLRALGNFEGKLFKIVAPNWSSSQKPKALTSKEREALGKLGF